jgi:hypothetical protein
MKPRTLIAAISAMACFVPAPLLAQEIEVDEDVSVDRRVMVIETGDTADDERIVKREVRVVRSDTGDKALARQLDDLEKVELRIVKMGDDTDISGAELRALTEERIADGKMVVFSAREMECERQATGEVRLEVCSSEGRASVLEALREARGTIAAETDLGADAKARALAALDRRIAELEAAADQ